MTRSRRIILAFPAAALVIAALVHSVRASAAAVIYQRVKFEPDRPSPEEALRACGRSHSLYPANYFVCLFAATNSYAASLAASGAEAEKLRKESEKWSDIGLAVNRYSRDLHLAKLAVMCADPGRRPAAVEFWEKYTEHHYWDPFNHFLLLKMYAWSGRIADAGAKAEFLEPTAYRAEAAKVLERAKEVFPPDGCVRDSR